MGRERVKEEIEGSKGGKGGFYNPRNSGRERYQKYSAVLWVVALVAGDFGRTKIGVLF